MVSNQRRIYLDHAATAWPKHPGVSDAIRDFSENCGAASGRGGYRNASIADQVVATTRKRIATMIGAESTHCISIHSNGTTALNAAIHGVLREGDHVVTTAAEHNSVLRPLHHWQTLGKIDLTVVPTDCGGGITADAIANAVLPKTRLVTLTHASNVTGAVQPIAEIGSVLRDTPTVFLCDAAQTFGALPIDVGRWGVDLLAAPAHKGSSGPLGAAFLYCRQSIGDQIEPTIQGGTGSQSESLTMPTCMPAKLEAGNLNVPALAGWNVALEALSPAEMKVRTRRLSALTTLLRDGLSAIQGVQLFGECRSLPIASITIENYAVTDLAMILDSEFGIEARAGLHCAALIHRHLGCEPQGTLRLSAGHQTTDAEIELAVEAIRVIAASSQGVS